jgi:hypothetical protein
MAKEIEELRTQLAELAEKVSTLESDLQVERQIGAIMRKKVAHCRVCQDAPDAALGHPPITELERRFCEQPIQDAVPRSSADAAHLVNGSILPRVGHQIWAQFPSTAGAPHAGSIS